jgi:hypothetical protein
MKVLSVSRPNDRSGKGNEIEVKYTTVLSFAGLESKRRGTWIGLFEPGEAEVPTRLSLQTKATDWIGYSSTDIQRSHRVYAKLQAEWLGHHDDFCHFFLIMEGRWGLSTLLYKNLFDVIMGEPPKL